jgi:hypothetical protein
MSKANSPVYDGFATPPATYPLGVSISDKISIKKIDERTATKLYECHHSYIPRGRAGTHHGIYLDGAIVGAISYSAYPSSASIYGYTSENIREFSRVCIAHDTPNLASCSMSKSQDKYIKQRGDEFELLVTFIREDYKGSMFKALRGKGWEYHGHSEGKQPGNSPNQDIYDHDKERWVCQI